MKYKIPPGKSPDGNTRNNPLSTGGKGDQTDSARSEGGRVEAMEGGLQGRREGRRERGKEEKR